MLIKSNFLSLWLVIVETKQSFSNLLFNSKSRDGELSRISSGYDDDLDEVREEDHVEDEDDLEVSCLAEIFGRYFQNKLIQWIYYNFDNARVISVTCE